MTNDATRASAQALPGINRRRMLLGLAAASTAATAAPAENAELVRLGDMLADLVAEYQAAVAARIAIVKEWSPRWPSAPEMIRSGFSGWGREVERDLTGRPFQYPNGFGEMRSRPIWRAVDAQERVDHWSKSFRRARVEKSKRWATEMREHYLPILDAAKFYEAECQRIHDLSGFPEANQREKTAKEALAAHILLILRQRAATMAGVLIQAQAIEAERFLPRGAMLIAELEGGETCGQLLAASLIRFAEGGAA